jgi:hypothetical protein
MIPSDNRLRLNGLNSVWAACWLGVALAFTAGQTIAGNVPGKDVAGCSRDTVDMLASPGGDWVAFVQDEICSDGAFQTSVVDFVQLARRGIKPTRKNDVFAVDSHGVYRPLLHWRSSHELQITVPNKSFIGLRKHSYRGIDVVVRFDQDDPIERQKILKSFGLIPE